MKTTARNPRLWYAVLAALSLAETLLMLAANGGPAFSFDSPSYIHTVSSLREGVPGLLRTPVLPLLIGLLRRLTGDVWPWMLVAVQTGAFLGSAMLLRRTARKYIGSAPVCFILTAYYMLAPGIVYWNTAVLTESLSLSATVALLWLMLRPLPGTPSARDVAASAAVLVFLLFLRPVFIYLLPVWALFHIIVFARSRGHRPVKAIATAAAGFALATGLLLAYTAAVHRHYGYRSMCSIPSINNYHMLRQSGLLCPELCDDAELRGILSTFPDSVGTGYGYDREQVWREINTMCVIRHTAAIEDYVNRVIAEHPGPVAATVADRLTSQSPQQSFLPRPDTFVPRPSIGLLDMLPSLPFSFGAYWLLMAVMAVMWALQWRRTRRMPLATSLLAAVSIGLVLTTLAGAMYEWQRLTLPALPAFLLLAGKFCSLFRRNENTL